MGPERKTRNCMQSWRDLGEEEGRLGENEPPYFNKQKGGWSKKCDPDATHCPPSSARWLMGPGSQRSPGGPHHAAQTPCSRRT